LGSEQSDWVNKSVRVRDGEDKALDKEKHDDSKHPNNEFGSNEDHEEPDTNHEESSKAVDPSEVN